MPTFPRKYCLVFANNLATAANGVITKKKLASQELSKYSLLFYNALIMIIPVVLFALYTGDLQKVTIVFLHDILVTMIYLIIVRTICKKMPEILH